MLRENMTAGIKRRGVEETVDMEKGRINTVKVYEKLQEKVFSIVVALPLFISKEHIHITLSFNLLADWICWEYKPRCVGFK